MTFEDAVSDQSTNTESARHTCMKECVYVHMSAVHVCVKCLSLWTTEVGRDGEKDK